MKESKKKFEGCGLYSVSIAREIGPAASIFILHIYMQMKKNESNSKFHVDGKIWVKSAISDLSLSMYNPSGKQIILTTAKCVKHGFIEKARLDGHPSNSVCWYTLTEKAIELCEKDIKIGI